MADPTLVFDVNETLLDMSALDPLFERGIGDVAARHEWFLTLQTLWMTRMMTGEYRPFDALARSALQMTAQRRGRTLAEEDEQEILEGMKQLPPHPDVGRALERLAWVGVELVALSNGTSAGLRAQLRHADLERYFSAVFSVQDVERYKPAREPYLHVAKRLGRSPRSLDLVSVHAWDIAGARAAGLFTIFVRRPGHTPDPAAAPADIEVADVGELARNIAARRAR